MKGYIKEEIQGICKKIQLILNIHRYSLDQALNSYYLNRALKLFLDLPIHIESTANWFDVSCISLSWFCHWRFNVLSVRDTKAQDYMCGVVMVCLSLIEHRCQMHRENRVVFRASASKPGGKKKLWMCKTSELWQGTVRQ